MGEQDDVEERFRRLVAEMESGSSPPLPKASRASMREVKREARQRKKAAARPPQPPAPHRAYLEAVSDLPGRGARRRTRRPRPARLHSERVRTISIGVAVLAIMASVIYFQWFRAATSTAI